MWETMNTLVQVSVVDSSQQPVKVVEGKNHMHRRNTQDRGSQTAPEKIPPTEVGHEVDPSAGSAASTGGNTVAIDNKIEQAMDLVKSHLMFAVREEVEVLKEKITELLERISQLEHENDILRANASAETLKQLSSQSQKKNTAGGKAQAVAPIPPST